ncbi:LuxR C-terminal-related transcriptional regulator [Limibaculum sp. FT325]|uniref:response regulator transcription factor n=1 Tax=Thermohalobaculum sediminis TaxID=2939436 RepID=UPI0020BF7C5C|nr:LuxR C-terminal-related transcriptional regulator [Limibaculum sediminis]MCL5776117.1 LuxR C-terminal-related transcriptional regulator [Limibaculum sediminis]
MTAQAREWHEGTGRVVAALRTPDFAPRLVEALGTLVAFDHSVMFAYRGDARPLDLFDNFGMKRREVFVSIYQDGPYLLDPFFQACRNRVAPGLYRIRELAPDRFYQSEYFRSYYVSTGLAEEIGFIVALPSEVRVVISLMRAGNRPAFSEREMRRLREVEPFVLAAAAANWESLASRFEGGEDARKSDILGRYLDDAFRNFGRSVLTPRESEVVSLVLRGHSSESIARVLDIAPGTVKIHRRNIYAKLGISSQANLFSLFISGLSGER